ncbi:MAG: LysR family transcriptional regulator [Pseudomonadota bacterium]
MNLSDLRIFVSAARRPTLGAAALELHLSPSAVSKALRRLEDSLGTALFDRSAKQLVLNQSGQRLLARAQGLLALAEQARDDIMGERAALDCRIGGPAVLLWRHGRMAAQALRGWPRASLTMEAMFEDDALAALARGDVSAAIVTGAVTDGRGAHWSPQWEATDLGSLNLHLVAGRTHALARGAHGAASVAASSAEVLEHDFACPVRSPFCGVRRGARSDGWRDDALPRKIRYWTDDLQLLLDFVRGGDALAYLPDFALADPALVRIEVSDCAFECAERAWLVWHKGRAGDWQQRLAEALARR